MKRLLRRSSAIILGGLIGLQLFAPTSAATFGEGKVTLVLVPGLTWEFITPDTAPNLHRMLETGGAANMALPLWGNDLSGYMALGSGSRSQPNAESVKAYQTGEQVNRPDESYPVPAEQLYERNTGSKPTGSIVVPGIEMLKKTNGTSVSQSMPGALGQAITYHGGRIALIGNSDLGKDVHRPAAMVAMNEAGEVLAGDIGSNLLKQDERAAYGVRSDYEQLFRLHESLKERSNLIVMEPGDATRVAAKRYDLPADVLQNMYLQALQSADLLIGRLLDGSPDRTIMVASPFSMSDVGIGSKSAGVLLMAGRNVAPGSLLSSNTTRQPGFVTIYDVAPTILSCLGLPDYIEGGSGQTIGFIEQSAAVEDPSARSTFLAGQIEQIAKLNEYRPFFVKGFAEAMLVLVLVAFVLRAMKQTDFHWPGTLLAALLPIPLLYLAVSGWGVAGLGDLLAKLGILAALYWTVLALLKRVSSRLLLTSLLTVAFLSIDMLRQGAWMAGSPFGYDLLGGARYYGIGNEYMGILIGAALLVFLLCMRHFPQHAARIRIGGAIGFILLVWLLAAPQYGTNAGGAAAAAVTFLYAGLQGATGRFSMKKWVWVLGGTAAICVFILLVNVLAPAEQQTHIGHAASLLIDGKAASLQEILARKWMLNWRLLQVSAWGMVFWGILLVLVVEAIRKSPAASPFLVGGISTFLLNDSGVIAAACCMLFGAVWLLADGAETESVRVERTEMAGVTAVEQLTDELPGEGTN